MTSLVYVGIAGHGDALVVLDASRRLYAGLSRDAGYWHVVHPAQVDCGACSHSDPTP